MNCCVEIAVGRTRQVIPPSLLNRLSQLLSLPDYERLFNIRRRPRVLSAVGRANGLQPPPFWSSRRVARRSNSHAG